MVYKTDVPLADVDDGAGRHDGGVAMAALALASWSEEYAPDTCVWKATPLELGPKQLGDTPHGRTVWWRTCPGMEQLRRTLRT